LRKISVRLAGVKVEIRTDHLRVTGLERYIYAKLFGQRRAYTRYDAPWFLQ
jgi:hypothetical protein